MRCRILIENGANLGALTIDNDLPIDLVPTGDDEVEHLPFIRYLDEEMRRRDMDASALRTREEEELLKDVGQLLGENCDVMVIVSRLTDPRSGASPLHVAAAKDYFTVLNELLELGADPDVTDSDNWTPLHVSVARSRNFSLSIPELFDCVSGCCSLGRQECLSSAD